MQLVTWRVMVFSRSLINSRSSTSSRVGVADALVHELNEAGDDGQRPVDVVDDAGVDLAARGRHLLFDLLALQLAQQFLQLLGVGVDLALQGAPLHGGGHGGAHGGDVERLVDVIAGAQPQRLAHGVGRFEGGHHHRFDGGIDVLRAAPAPRCRTCPPCECPARPRQSCVFWASSTAVAPSPAIRIS